MMPSPHKNNHNRDSIYSIQSDSNEDNYEITIDPIKHSPLLSSDTEDNVHICELGIPPQLFNSMATNHVSVSTTTSDSNSITSNDSTYTPPIITTPTGNNNDDDDLP